MATNNDNLVANRWIYSDTIEGFSTKINTGDICMANVIVPDELIADIFKPERITYKGKSTVCFWKDGTKTTVTASEDDPFIKEFGVAMATIKKIYGNRLEFLRKVESGFVRQKKNEKI